MALTVKHNRANHTHENEQFRRVASSMKLLFKQQDWTGLLIGNPFNETYSRFRADAILLYDHGLIIIDFKVYGGTIKLPGIKKDFEMSQWYTESDDDKKRTLIKAGNRFINPFRQLYSYREAFKEIVRSNIQLNELIQETKTCALNLFSGPLIIENSIPPEVPFYKITQESSLGTFLYDFSSENTYSEETAEILSNLFSAKDWLEHIDFPNVEPLEEKSLLIDKNVQTSISDFLKSDGSGILVLESMSSQERDEWVTHILSEAHNFNIPQVETWVHSSRIGRKASARLGFELQSLYNTIYGGAPRALETVPAETKIVGNNTAGVNTLENDSLDDEAPENESLGLESIEKKEEEDEIQEVIPIRSDDSIDGSAVIILHEAHLVSRSLHQSDLLRFGSGKLLDDLLMFLGLDKTKRKLVCIGDPYSLTYGKDSESAINLGALREVYGRRIDHYRQPLAIVHGEGKLGLRNILAAGIENKLFNELEYPWKPNDLLEINKDEISKYLVQWFSTPFDSDPTNTVLFYSNKDAKRTNSWIKMHCLKNGKDLAKKDLLYINNNVNIPDETGFGQPTKLYNGMFLLVEEVGQTINEVILLKPEDGEPISLQFTKAKVKCISIQNKSSAEVWLLDNYFQGDGKLSKNEHIAFRVFVNRRISYETKKQPFERSYEQKQLAQNENYKRLLAEENDLKVKLQAGEKVKTKLEGKRRELRKIENNYKKKFKRRIFSLINQTDPLVNAIHASYGWSLTVHKGIGSTFTNVIINAFQGENKGTTNAEYYRWLYSGATATSGIFRIANAQIIHPLMEIHSEDTIVTPVKLSKSKKKYLEFEDYKTPDRFREKIPDYLKDSIKGSICELAKLLEPMGYILESVNPCGEYLNKASFSVPADVNKHLIIAFSNKGTKDNWGVSSIRIEKCEDGHESNINRCLEDLFRQANAPKNDDSALPVTGFRGKVYEKWFSILADKGLHLELVESHRNQDVFIVTSESLHAKFRVWYRDDGFFSRFIMLEKSAENLGDDLKKWLIDGNN